MKSPWLSLSVFLPVYNEGEALEGVLSRSLEALAAMDIAHYELIVVNDGSSDQSGEIANRWAEQDTHVRVIHHQQNTGYGGALVSGLAAAQYEWVCYTDGDGQFNLNDLQRFYEPSLTHDVVLGYRRVRKDHWGRRLNAWLWGQLVNGILGLRVRDVDCGFKLFKTDAVRSLGPLESRGAVISPELLKKFQVADYDWAEVEVNHYPREGGEPSGARLSVILKAMRELWQLRQKFQTKA